MSAPAPGDPGEVRPVALRAVESELARIWRGGDPESSTTVTRACMSNLIIVCGSEAEAARVAAELPEIALVHPSRVLLVTASSDAPASPVEASVSACCTIRGSSKICSEVIALRASGSAVDGLPAAVRPLLIGDLPTALWWTPSERSPAEEGRIFQRYAQMAVHVIYDSRGWLEPARGVVATASWTPGSDARVVVSDLAWLRLESWRRLIAQSLDPSVAPGALASIDEVVVDHGPHALPKAWLLVGWLAHRLGWRASGGRVQPGVEIDWTFDSPSGLVRVAVRRRESGEAELYKVSLGWSGGGERFERVGPERIVAGAGDSPRVLATLPRPRSGLLARELAARRGDALFREALQHSKAMAETLLNAENRGSQ